MRILKAFFPCPFVFLFLLSGGLAARAFAGEPPALFLLPKTQVDGEGIFLAQITTNGATLALPQIRLGDAPPFGQALLWSKVDVINLARKAAPELALTNWAGADRV